MQVQPASPLLSLRNVIKERRQEHTFSLFVPHLDIMRGERIALLGRSGSGKSTLLDMLALILKPEGAERFLFSPGNTEYDIMPCWNSRNSADSLGKLRLGHMGYVLQTGGLLPFLTVRDNILLSCKVQGRPNDRAKLDELVQRLSIGHLLDKLPGKISLGERQRVSIARALIHGPDLVIADEPTAALDPITGAEVFKLLLELSEGTTLIVATHDWSSARKKGFRVLGIDLHASGTGADTAVSAVVTDDAPDYACDTAAETTSAAGGLL